MKTSKLFMVILMSILLITSFACKNDPAESEHEGQSEGEEVGMRPPETWPCGLRRCE